MGIGGGFFRREDILRGDLLPSKLPLRGIGGTFFKREEGSIFATFVFSLGSSDWLSREKRSFKKEEFSFFGSLPEGDVVFNKEEPPDVDISLLCHQQ